MDHLQKFNIRGTIIEIPLLLLKRKPESLLYMLSNPSFDAPIDKINDAIYVDIDPNNIEIIVDCYNNIYLQNDDMNIFQYMDLKYLNLIDNTTFFDTSMMNTNDQNSVISDITCDYKYCIIRTFDRKTILLDLTMYKGRNDNIMKSILFGKNEEYVINIDQEKKSVCVWIGMTEIYINKIISIIRDGIEWYYPYLTSNMNNLIDVSYFESEYKNHLERYNLNEFVNYKCNGKNNEETGTRNFVGSSSNFLNGIQTFNVIRNEPMEVTFGKTKWGENDIVGQMLFNKDIGKKINYLINESRHYIKIIKYLEEYGICSKI